MLSRHKNPLQFHIRYLCSNSISLNLAKPTFSENILCCHCFISMLNIFNVFLNEENQPGIQVQMRKN